MPPLAGVVGSPIRHSLSPLLHTSAYAALGLTDWAYCRHEVGAGELAAYLQGLGAEWAGLSVTMPGKEEALALASSCGPEARLVGAANTLTRRPGGWRADNTDVHGLARALGEAGVQEARTAVLVGAGATARSALVALNGLGVRQVRVLVRDQVREPTRALARRLGIDLLERRYADPDAERLPPAQVVVSTVPAGAAPAVTDLGPVPDAVVVDVVYAPWPTPLAAALRAEGVCVVGGGSMLLHQAAEQVRLMTGLKPPLEAMRTALATAGPEVGG